MSGIESGFNIGRYAIQKTLGAGAMGVVYLARDPQIDRLLAIKTVRLQGGSPAEIEDRKQRLLREAKTAGSLIHPNVVTLFDAGEHEGQLYLAFEFVDGSSLGEKLAAEGPPKLGEALRIAHDAAEGLGYAHAHGIVHRDVKPANILISAAGKVKVGDFGIAKIVGQATELTVTGTVVGSPHYLSPEQVRGEPLDGRSDVFSLGVVFYELLGGSRPFDGETFTTLLYQILHQEPPPIRLKPRLVPLVADVLRRMLAKDRNQRYADGAEAARALLDLARQLPQELLAEPAVADTTVEPTRLFSTEEISSVMPPPPPPSIGEAATLPASPPPPPRPASAPPPVAPLPPRPPQAGVARSSSRGKWIAAIVGGLVILGVGAVAAVFVLSRVLGLGAPQTSEGEKPPAEIATSPSSEAPSNPTATEGRPPASNPAPSNNPAKADPPPIRPPGPSQTGRPFDPANRPTPVRDAIEARVEDRRPLVPAPEDPAPADTVDTRGYDTGDDAEPEPEPEPIRLPTANAVPTGMKIFFEGFPDDDDDPPIFAVIDGRNIGKVTDYDRKRPYELPDPGEHRLKITGGGYEKLIILNAAEGRAPTLFPFVGLARGGVGGTGSGRAVLVKRGIRLRGPDDADVAVDGQFRGKLREFTRMNPLVMAPGSHTVTVTYGGRTFTQQVTVSPGAPKPIVLVPVPLG